VLDLDNAKGPNRTCCTIRAFCGESPAIPLVLSWMVIYLTASRPSPPLTGTASYPRFRAYLDLHRGGDCPSHPTVAGRLAFL
jgi:hypothetical protein